MDIPARILRIFRISKICPATLFRTNIKNSGLGLWLGVAGLVIWSGSSGFANTIDFTTATIGPTGTLQFGGATVTTGNDVGVVSLPAMVTGVGLGSGTIGSPGTVDRIQTLSGVVRESLSITVPGIIDSITVVPFFTVTGPNDSVFIPFDISLPIPSGFLPVNDTAPRTIVFPQPVFAFSTVDLGLIQDFPLALEAYLQEHPTATLDFGFTVTSLTFSPTAAVPDPASTLAELGCSFLLLGTVRRFWSRRRVT